jgi:hypothetical protein
MKADRGANQILHGYLPEQTVDLYGGIWKVSEWRTPRYVRVDTDALRREIVRLARPWEAAGNDGAFVKRLREGRAIRVHALDLRNGVLVDRFPAIWQCKSCHRVRNSYGTACRCGANTWGQLHFVGYHSCGRIEEPYIPRCPAHDDVRVIFPGSSDARQIRFECPVCRRQLRQGFGFGRCSCGNGQLSYTVHRAASVFTPRSVAVVSAPSDEHREQLRRAGGAERALSWVVSGMPEGGITTAALDDTSLVEDLVAKGIDRSTAMEMAKLATDAGGVSTDLELPDLGPNAQVALDQSVTIYNATVEGRSSGEHLIAGTTEHSALGARYRTKYPLACHRTGLAGIDLCEEFPVLSGYYGYTRGDQTPGASSLRTWRDPRTSSYVVYGELQQTEAMLFRLDPIRVATWLRRRGHTLPETADDRSARIAILKSAEIPAPGAEVDRPTMGSDVLTLVHSLAHRVIRQTAVLAGIDRNALSELLVPNHLGFFVYSATRGGFVLGGLQALFETELDQLLDGVVHGERRCALDPGCTHDGGACVACLHLGEPSCRYFNGFLDRRALFGDHGLFGSR